MRLVTSFTRLSRLARPRLLRAHALQQLPGEPGLMRTENVGSKEENLGDVVEEGEPPREVEGCVEERRSDLPVIDVTTPSQDGSSEHLL